MTMYYTAQDLRSLEEIHKEGAVENAIGRKPAGDEERDRIWHLLTLAARGEGSA
jgi:hypothetical protein